MSQPRCTPSLSGRYTWRGLAGGLVSLFLSLRNDKPLALNLWGLRRESSLADVAAAAAAVPAILLRAFTQLVARRRGAPDAIQLEYRCVDRSSECGITVHKMH